MLNFQEFFPFLHTLMNTFFLIAIIVIHKIMYIKALRYCIHSKMPYLKKKKSHFVRIKLNTTIYSNTQILSLMQCYYCRSDQCKFKPVFAPWCKLPFFKKIQSHLLNYCLHLFGAATMVSHLFPHLKRPRMWK